MDSGVTTVGRSLPFELEARGIDVQAVLAAVKVEIAENASGNQQDNDEDISRVLHG